MSANVVLRTIELITLTHEHRVDVVNIVGEAGRTGTQLDVALLLRVVMLLDFGLRHTHGHGRTLEWWVARADGLRPVATRYCEIRQLPIYLH